MKEDFLDMMNDEEFMKELYESFTNELKEMYANIDNIIKDGVIDEEKYNEIFRYWHRLKGSAGVIGLEKISKFAHYIENLLEDYKEPNKDKSEIIGLMRILLPFLIDITNFISQGETPKEEILKKAYDKVEAFLQGQVIEEEEGESFKPVIDRISVKVEDLDRILDKVIDLIVNFSKLKNRFMRKNMIDDDTLYDIEKFSNEISEIHFLISKARMLPIYFLFKPFIGFINKTAADLGKKVRVIMKGSDTLIDKTIIDTMYDPLKHILRNALDHGIEIPEERKKKNKEATGKIILRAYQRQGYIFIEVEDDGRGIDLNRIKEKAVKMRIISSMEENIDSEKLLDIIFLPGFSTREKASDLSGRGYGMDIVKSIVESLNGSVSVETQEDKGTKIILKLPSSLMVIKGFLAKYGGSKFILPIESLEGFIRKEVVKDIIKQNGKIYAIYGEETLPIIDVSNIWGFESKEFKYISYAIFNGIRGRFLFPIDDILEEGMYVVKSLEKNYENKPGIMGTTILGDGTVCYILDPDTLYVYYVNIL